MQQRLPDQIEAEARWLRAQRQPVLVLGDVAPAAAALADAVGAPLVWIANFGWDAIYRPMGAAFEAWADLALAAYRTGDALIQCPFSMAMPWGVPTTPVGLTPGRPRHQLDQLQRRLQLNQPRERTVLVGFGGLGLSLAPPLFARWPQHHFLVSDPALCAGAANVTLLPPDLRPLEWMPLCGRILTKPGYEAPVLEAALQRHGWHRLLSREQLEQGDWQLDQPLEAPLAAPLPLDGDRTAAEVIVATASSMNASVVDG
ncbi:MAG: hypothetical protein RLZZ11_1732 [Cyanobacteriota bacterium]